MSCAPRAWYDFSQTPQGSRGVDDYPHFTEGAEAERGRTTGPRERLLLLNV